MYEPFYQLMRTVMLGEKMVRDKEFGVTEAKVVVVCPNENIDYRDVITSPALRKKFSSISTVEEVFAAVLNDKSIFTTTSQEDLIKSLRHVGYKSKEFNDWNAYQLERYGW